MTRTDMEDPNWKNVGNWHWVSKDVFPYAKEYFTGKLMGCEKKENRLECKITEVSSFTGDCTLSVRKGKLITIYDLSLTFGFLGKDENDQEVKGTVQVPEIMSDFSDSDFVFELNPDSTSNEFQQFLKKKVYPEVIRVCQALPDHVVQNQSRDVFIENAVPSVDLPKADLEERKKLAMSMSSSTAAPIATVRASTALPVPPPIVASKSTSEQETRTLSLTFHFMAQVADVRACFTDDQRVRQWTQGQGSFDSNQQTLKLFDQIEATICSSEDSSLEMTWKMKSWKQPSHVSMQFKQKDQAQLVLLHSQIPQHEQPAVERHWRETIQRIKVVFGYGSFF